MSKALPANLEQIEVNLKKLTNQRTRSSLLGIAILILVFFSGTLVSLEANAGSFGRGIANFFNYPRFICNVCTCIKFNPINSFWIINITT